MNPAASIRIVLLSTDKVLDDRAARLVMNFTDISLTRSATEWSEIEDDAGLAGAIVLLDAELGGEPLAPGLIRSIRAAGARVITLSSFDAPAAVMKAMAAGADAALRKRDSSRRIADQLRLAANRDQLIRQRSARH